MESTKIPPVIVANDKSAERPRIAWWMVLSLTLLAAALVILHQYDPAHSGFYPKCFLYTTTGIYCPGCGCLRATHQLLLGHILVALRCNPLYVLSLPWLGIYLFKCGVSYFRKGAWPEFNPSRGEMLWAGVVLLIFTLLRNIHSAPFCYLAPG